ncbi:uncharacterized protein [Haliotis cracherodii]|uniref:uncharacterized protein n=1 Tax=Haliotis cracherodii TaxID=6455 RepID=UPI0039EA4AD2
MEVTVSSVVLDVSRGLVTLIPGPVAVSRGGKDIDVPQSVLTVVMVPIVSRYVHPDVVYLRVIRKLESVNMTEVTTVNVDGHLGLLTLTDVTNAMAAITKTDKSVHCVELDVMEGVMARTVTASVKLAGGKLDATVSTIFELSYDFM